MLVDPITVAAAAPTPALTLAVIKSDGYATERMDLGGSGFSTIINHSKSKAGNTHYVQMIQTKDVTDTYTGAVRPQKATVSLTIRRPAVGFSDVDTVALTKALTDFLADSDVTVAKLLLFQS